MAVDRRQSGIVQSCCQSGSGETLAAEGGSKGLPEIKVGKDESFDNALRRFKRECQRSGILRDVRKHEHYESPSVKRKKKSEAARRRRWY